MTDERRVITLRVCVLCGRREGELVVLIEHPTRDFRGQGIVVLICKDPWSCTEAAALKAAERRRQR